MSLHFILRSALCLILFFATSSSSAQIFFPPVTNYSSNMYNAASQNWGLSSDVDGVLYAANNEGLLRFDGQRWEVFTLPNQILKLSMKLKKKLIYL